MPREVDPRVRKSEIRLFTDLAVSLFDSFVKEREEQRARTDECLREEEEATEVRAEDYDLAALSMRYSFAFVLARREFLYECGALAVKQAESG